MSPSASRPAPFEIQWEEAWPAAAGLFAGCLALAYGADLFKIAEAKSWHIDALYNSMFALTAASSAFLFSLYTYAKTADIYALNLIRDSKMFKRANKYIINNVAFCFLVSILTIPFTIIVPQPKEDGFILLIFAIWAGASVLAICGSVRSIGHFIAILNAAEGSKYRD